MIRRALLGAALFTILLTGPASAATVQVSAVDPASFSPSSKTINVGDKITWTNTSAGTRDHTSTSNDTSPINWNFTLDENDASPPSGSVTFGHVGTYGYHCLIHDSMKGTVLVKLGQTRIDSNSWTIRAGSPAPTGASHFVQFRKKGTTTWMTLGTFTTATKRFDAPSAGTWQLRGQYKKSGKSSGFSPILEVVTQ